jgi:RsiW-degrading membrane proteinase PrsW (M82 family)
MVGVRSDEGAFRESATFKYSETECGAMVSDLVMLLVLGFVPAIAWLGYFYSRDRYSPEPRGCILRIFLLGMASTIPIALLEALIGVVVPSDFLLAVVVAPIVEECGKFLVVYLFVFRRPVFDEPVDGIVYAVTAALGFAALENFVYVFAAYSETLALPLGLSIIRALFSVPGHALMSAMWGYALGQSLVTSHPVAQRLVFEGLGLAILLHAAFNFFVSIELVGAIVMVLVLVPGMWLLATRKIAQSLAPVDRI